MKKFISYESEWYKPVIGNGIEQKTYSYVHIRRDKYARDYSCKFIVTRMGLGSYDMTFVTWNHKWSWTYQDASLGYVALAKWIWFHDAKVIQKYGSFEI